MYRRRPSSCPAGRRHSAGGALLPVLLIGAILVALGTIGAQTAQVDLRITQNNLLAQHALTAGDAGIDHAISLIRTDMADGFDDELSGGGTGGGLTALGTLTSVNGQACREHGLGGTSGTYCVWARDNVQGSTTDTDKVIEVVSLGRVLASQRTVEALVEMQVGPDCAFTAEEDLTISGNPTFAGAEGCAHSNQDLSIPGNPVFSVAPTASATIAMSGNPVIEQTTYSTSANKTTYATNYSGQPQVALPSVNPLAFGPNADDLAAATAALGAGYRLDSNCRVYQGGSWTCSSASPYCSGGTQVANLSSGGSYLGWECSSDSSSNPPALWKVSSNTAGTGVFFVEGWVNISGNPGTLVAPWRVTIIAMNTIDVSGNPVMAPYTTTGTLRNLLLVSGNDVGLSGNLGAGGVPGAILAHQQIKTNGDITLNGFLIAEGGKSSWANEPAPTSTSGKDIISVENSISGNSNITYNGLDTVFVATTLRRRGWVDVRAY